MICVLTGNDLTRMGYARLIILMYLCKINNIMYMLIIHGANNLMHDVHRVLIGYGGIF